MPPAVVLPDIVIVVDPILVAGVVRWVDVNDADAVSVRGFEQAQGIVVVAFDDEVAIRASRLAIAAA